MKEHRNSLFIIFRLAGSILLLAALMLLTYNIYREFTAYESVKRGSSILGEIIEHAEQKDDYHSGGKTGEKSELVSHPEIPMPEVMSDGYPYIGLLKIDKLALELPIISHWSYDALNVAPARYSGTVYLDNMVIAAHNYTTHFGRIDELEQGDVLTFKDMDGKCYTYEVRETEILGPDETEAMVSSNFDLSLFTCTVGGASRVTVRCNRLSCTDFLMN